MERTRRGLLRDVLRGGLAGTAARHAVPAGHVREGDHAAHKGDPLLPDHEPHRPARPDARHLPRGAVDCSRLGEHLWNNVRIIVVPIKRDDYQGIRVTPNVYTTLDEIDTFAEIVEAVAKRGSL